MKKDYQTTSTPAAMAVPDAVSIAMTNLADELREGLLALAVGTGLQVMDAIWRRASPRCAGREAATTRRGQPCATATRTAR